MTSEKIAVLTIGHSNHMLDDFVSLLRKHEVTQVADVRSVPYSRYNPQFDRESLKQVLKVHGIKYVFLGREIGARPEDRSCYENGRVRYALLAQTDLFREGIKRVVQNAKENRVALMCAEKEPLDCHRTILVAKALTERGVAVEHILPDGRLESQEATLKRLLDTPNQGDFFLSEDERIEKALVHQEERVAYAEQEAESGGA